MLPRSRTVATMLVVNVATTVVTAALVGPASPKLDALGLVGWAARAPFYLLPLALGPLVLWTRPRVGLGSLVGLAIGLPLALWSIATRCPPSVPVAYLLSAVPQGGVLGRLADDEPAG